MNLNDTFADIVKKTIVVRPTGTYRVKMLLSKSAEVDPLTLLTGKTTELNANGERFTQFNIDSYQFTTRLLDQIYEIDYSRNGLNAKNYHDGEIVFINFPKVGDKKNWHLYILMNKPHWTYPDDIVLKDLSGDRKITLDDLIKIPGLVQIDSVMRNTIPPNKFLRKER